MIAMEDKIGDSQFSPERYFNSNDDNSNGYQDSVVKSILDNWYNENIAGTDYEQFVVPVSLSNPTLGIMKRLGWQSNEVGKITTDIWKQEIIDPSKYPTIAGSGEKQAFLMSGSDVSADNFGNLSQAAKVYQEKLLEKSIDTLWLRTPGVASNNVSYLDAVNSQAVVVLSTVNYTRSVVPSLVVQTFENVAPVTVKYQDDKGNIISDNIVKSGSIGESYTTEQKAIDGYTSKEVQGNPTGQFTDQEQTVTYVYTKNNVTPSPKPDDHSDIPKSNKDTNNQTKHSTEDVSKLPQTGENESLSLIGMIFGLLLILGTTLMIIFKRKRQD